MISTHAPLSEKEKDDCALIVFLHKTAGQAAVDAMTLAWIDTNRHHHRRHNVIMREFRRKISS